MVGVLTRHDYCFVTVGGDVQAYFGRDEMQGPVARMWLFGLITTLELAMTEQVRAAGDESYWTTLLTPSRLEKACALQQARAGLGRPVPLVDCLQLRHVARHGRVLHHCDTAERRGHIMVGRTGAHRGTALGKVKHL